jgi:hypothetical protein
MVQIAASDHGLTVWIENHEIGVLTDGYRALAIVEPGQAGGSESEPPRKHREIDPALDSSSPNNG